ncbi:MAG TPA: phytanoyl-CoA dioxygenase family protein [Steroidobacteraceae bacterium]|nr:phytanoyl-CoA dioxygenase family protein [Steroidobacteraceae bacterium]
MFEITPAHIEQFRRDGFLVLERFLSSGDVERARARFEPLFRGEFETGLYPDEWNWREDRDSPDRTRQICNGWKSDRTIASIVLREEIGRLCATLAGWTGARIGQDNVLWKPPGAKALGFHQDDSYCHWVIPLGFTTCWMALDDTTAAGGTLEYARGSHRWGLFPRIREFHAPEDYREALESAARSVGGTIDLVPVEVPAGGCAVHAGGLWHGSDVNRTREPRRSLVTHCLRAEARFHPTEVSYIYSRYRRVGDDTLDESFFPVLWTRSGYRTPFLESYCDLRSSASSMPNRVRPRGIETQS